MYAIKLSQLEVTVNCFKSYAGILGILTLTNYYHREGCFLEGQPEYRSFRDAPTGYWAKNMCIFNA